MAETFEELVAKFGKVGRYKNQAEPFHCDVNHNLFMGHLGNHLLNAADFHSSDRGFGMRTLNTINKTWVLSRLVIEMDKMPKRYDEFYVESWVESAMRFFTNRNFRVVSEQDEVLGYGRSIWALIDTETRQPSNLLEVKDGEILKWAEPDLDCPIAKPGRVKMSKEAPLVGQFRAAYNDVDVNGHVNSIKYIEHVLDIFPLSYYKEYMLHRFEIAYVAESYYGDTLKLYEEKIGENEYEVRITKATPDGELECCRSSLRFKYY